MIVQVVYCNFQTTDLSVRERLAFPSEEHLHRAYGALRRDFPQSEHVVLSTCNRVELYTAQDTPDTAPSRDRLAQFLSDFHQVPLDRFQHGLLAEIGPNAVRHLFLVASSLDSMVLGEPQIVNQVKEAYRIAQENGACDWLTHELFQQAVRVSARVRSETRLSEGRVSVASVAVSDFGKKIFDRFDDKTVLVIGAGEMAEETVRYLQDAGAKQIVIVNRSLERAEELAKARGGVARPFSDLDRSLAEADIIVSTTGSTEPIVDRARFAAVRKQTGRKPVCILDLGAPRDFERAVGDVDENVFLYDIDDLEATCERNRQARKAEVERGIAIVDEEAERFMHSVYFRATGATVRELREMWHKVREDEVRKLFTRLPNVNEQDRQTIERSIEQIVNKLLHPPMEALRDHSKEGPPHGLIEALRRLFHLG